MITNEPVCELSNAACRPLFAGLLQNLEQFPPEAVLSILTLLQTRVLGIGEAIPGKLQAEPFGDTALSQVWRRVWLELFDRCFHIILKIHRMKSMR